MIRTMYFYKNSLFYFKKRLQKLNYVFQNVSAENPKKHTTFCNNIIKYVDVKLLNIRINMKE